MKREILPLVQPVEVPQESKVSAHIAAEDVHPYLTASEIEKKIKFYESEMKKAAKAMQFEEAARFRDLMRKYRSMEIDS